MTWHPDMPDEFKNQIVTGDARELAKQIPDESIDLIFTDPVYDRIDDYRWLAETAVRVLKPDRACLVFCGIGYLPETLQALLGGGLSYRWQLILLQPTRNGCHIPGGFSHYTNLLWLDVLRMSKPNKQIRDIGRWLSDPLGWARVYSDVSRWFQDPNFVSYYLDKFADADCVVADFFTGSGTVPAVCKMLGRNYVAFEIDPITADKARERVRNTQPPLFVLEPEQMELDL